jgi:hypothetical protein
MNKIDKVDIIANRSRLLAKVVLTRRLNVDVHPFSDANDNGIDLICTIRPDPEDMVQGFLPFATVVWGTAKELMTTDEATSYARFRRKSHDLDDGEFFMPVIVLLFSMQKDEAYFSWLVKPYKDSNKLMRVKDLSFTHFDRRELDKMVSNIKKWYQRLTTTLLVGVEETDSTHVPANG